MILILRDLTSQKRAEVDREAGRNAMALAEMSAELAHEIRNPLASLELFAGLLDDGEGERKLWTSHMRAGIRSLSTIVNNVLALRSSGELRMEPLQLSGIIAEALDLAEPLLQQAGLSLDWEPEFREIINCNSGALQQLVLNLVTNAIRYTPSGGRVKVSIRRESDTDGVLHAGVLVLEFADSGCGIPSDQIHRIFDRGYSGSGRSGLGLAVCERIMREHGGSISVVNGVDEGARFRLKFPLLKMEYANV
jgi:two-component system sensor histidine kinase FlrB